MAFGDFTYPEVFVQLGLTFENSPNLFAGVEAIPGSVALWQQLAISVPLATTLNTEKARSEFMDPILCN